MRPATARSLMRLALLSHAAFGAAAPAPAAEGAWKLGLNVSESFNTNVRLGEFQSGRLATRVGGKLSRGFQGPRWQLGFSGSGSKPFFHGRTSPRANGIFYGAGVQFGYQLSESAAFSVADNFKSSYTGEAFDFVQLDEDVLLPLNRQKRNHARAALDVELSPSLTMILSASHDMALFNQDEVSQPRLTNGDRLSGGLGFSWKQSDRNSLNLGYIYSRSDQRVEVANIHGVSLGFARVLGQYTNMGVSIGGSRRDTGVDTRYTLTGGAAIAKQLENFNFALSYRRDLSALFGLGRNVVHNTFRLSHSQKLTRIFGIHASGAYSRTRDPSDPSFSYDSWSVNGGPTLSLNPDRGWHVGVTYSFAMRERLPSEGEGRQFQSHRIGVQVGWNTVF